MNMRIGGLASGMDTDQLVRDLMKAERLPLNKLKQKRQIFEWQRDEYRAINTLLLDFRSELTNMRLTSRYRARVTDSTNPDRVTATATSAASQASYSIENVSQLASAATKANSSTVSNKLMDSTKGLHQQKHLLGTDTSYWKTGSVETKTITGAGSDQVRLDEPDSLIFQDIESWSVKVNGTAFKVVTSGIPSDNEVLISSDGTLTFNKVMTITDSIKVDYVKESNTQSLTIDKSTNTWQLSKGSINTVSSFTLENGEDVETFTLGETVDGKMGIFNSNDVQIGSLSVETGIITFDEELSEGTKLNITYTQNYTTFSLDTSTSNGQKHENFLVQGNESLNSVINRVNSSPVGVTMFYDSVTDRMTITRKETGDFNSDGDEIITSGDFLNKGLKFEDVTETGGTNAIFKINGVETNRSSNTFEMSGVTFTLKQVFTETPQTAVQVTVSNDTNKVFENIKSFVDKYNDLISKINGKLSETRYRDYLPLTDEERENLSEKQQETWEEKAKSGLLRRDSTLTSLLSRFRTNWYSPVNNGEISSMFNQLSSIGITTTPNYLEGGKLVIDEAKLKKAIEEDPTSIEKLFTASGLTDGEKGIAQRLTDTVNASMNVLREKAGNSFSTNQQFAIGRNLLNLNSQINRFETRLTQVEDRYWKQFTAMEKALQKSNNQYAYLMQQFSSGM